MGVQTIHLEATTAAGAEAVWHLVGNSATWPTWTPIETYTAVQPAGPEGTGEIRLFTTGRVTVREEIVVRRPPDRLSYVLLGGLALRDYRADISVTPEPAGGSHLTWHTEFRPKVPGSGWLYKRAIAKATRQFVEGLAAHAAADAE